jgi:Ni/Co efflux regulator RcnB
MNKFFMGAMAAIVGITGTAGPVMAQPFHGDRHQVEQRTVVKTVVVKQPRYHSWRKGDRFDSRYARDYRVISNPRMYRLHNAPRGYHWVRSGNDAVLVGVTSGIIAAIMGNAVR